MAEDKPAGENSKLNAGMGERAKLAFDFARDTTKQLIALATGVIALGITFSRDFVENVDAGVRMWAVFSWAFFLISVFFGLLALLALTGTFEPSKEHPVPASIRGRHITIPSGLQVITFFLGLLLSVVFGFLAVK